ncbi:MAG: DUF3520 domain-containing protein [bacterium]|nr:DUF3520 domain-containing protein [bacterium]
MIPKKLAAEKLKKLQSLGYLPSGSPSPVAEPVSTETAVAFNDTGTASNTEEYDRLKENAFKDAKQNPLSTFSIDVDNASYSNIRRFINKNQLPPKDSVRIEEMINYFTYDYPQPKGRTPFSITTEVSKCPWNYQHKLVHIGLQGKRLDYDELRPSNLIFLVDSSGSMQSRNKLPLLKKSLGMLLDGLDDKDKVSIVAYAGSAGLVLPSTPASRKNVILRAIDQLSAGGSTAGGAGIQLAYKVAKENFIKNGNNRVILCTDGDFNVGVSSTGSLVRYIENKRKDDVYLTICGFGMGNYKDGRMEQISNAGNGNYFYIDTAHEARKVFVKEMRANMFAIAKDVKIQVEFNPAHVKAYRLVGYENRVMANEDFADDKKDAGELGAGHTVTALYEIIASGSSEKVRKTAELRYQQSRVRPGASESAELMTVKLRYKFPKESKSRLIESPLIDRTITLANTSNNFRFSSAVAGFGMLLKNSKYKGDINYSDMILLAKHSKGKDIEGYRTELVRMMETCDLIDSRKKRK